MAPGRPSLTTSVTFSLTVPQPRCLPGHVVWNAGAKEKKHLQWAMDLAVLCSPRPFVSWQLAALFFSLSLEMLQSGQLSWTKVWSGDTCPSSKPWTHLYDLCPADLFSGLDSCSDQGIINYGVSMTTLEDVFLRLEEETTADQEGTIVAANIQSAAEENGYFAITPGHASNSWLLGGS